MGCDVGVNAPTISEGLISIHAPIVGCDEDFFVDIYALDISIHAPIVGCDLDDNNVAIYLDVFQSTHPSWGATVYVM